MKFNNVCVEGIACHLPENCVTSADIEERLRPVYERLRLPEGRLELMTGISERRFWEQGTRPSEVSALAGRKAMDKAGVEAADIECLIHCSVCRDYVEPATSTAVHRLLELPQGAINFDISNACLGVISGMLTIANMIELGQIKTGLVVAGESAGPLVEGTLRELLTKDDITRKTIKPYFASLTIGSAAVGVVLTSENCSKFKHKLLGGSTYANTSFNHLCEGTADIGMTGDVLPNMQTDSEELLVRGIEVAVDNWQLTKKELQWDNDSPDVICCHQVGKAHRDLLYKSLQLDLAKDHSTFPFMGNCGSASLPATVAFAEEKEVLKKGDKVAMLGIGSGINSTMLGLLW